MKVTAIIFLVLLGLFENGNADITGFWVGKNSGKSSDGYFEVLFGKDSLYEFRNKDIHKGIGEQLISFTHAIGKWGIHNDSLFYFLEKARAYDSSFTDVGSVSIGKWRGVGLKTYEENGTQKMLYIMEYEGIRDTAYFEYKSSTPAFTFPGALNFSSISQFHQNRVASNSMIRLGILKLSEFDFLGKKIDDAKYHPKFIKIRN